MKLVKMVKWGLRLAPGLLIFAMVLLSPSLRRADGWLLPIAWSLLVGAVSLTLLIGAWATRWQRCASLLALALAGQACALQLIDAPPYSVYQRYFSWNQNEFAWSQMIDLFHLLPLLGLVVQSIIVIRLSQALWPTVKEKVPNLLTRRRTILCLFLLMFISVLFSTNILRYSAELVMTGWVALISALNLALVATAVPADSLEKIIEWLKSRIESDSEGKTSIRTMNRVLPWLIVVWVVVVSALLSSLVFERVPHIPDDVSYLFQAKYFSTGHLSLPVPPNNASFAISNVVNDGTKWFAYGFPRMALSTGCWYAVWFPVAGKPVYCRHHSAAVPHLDPPSVWLANRTCGGFALRSVSSVSFHVRQLYGPHGFRCLAAGRIACIRQRTGERGLWGILAGVSLGLLFLTRPLEGLLTGLVVGLWALGILGGVRLGPRGLAGFMAACVIVGAAIFPYNYALTGNPTYSAHLKWSDQTWYPGGDRIGFGSNIGNVGWPHIDPLPGHGPVDVVVNANKNFYMANFELFGWSFGSLVFVALMVLLGTRQKADWIFMALAVAVVAGHSVYWFSGGPDFRGQILVSSSVAFCFADRAGRADSSTTIDRAWDWLFRCRITSDGLRCRCQLDSIHKCYSVAKLRKVLSRHEW